MRLFLVIVLPWAVFFTIERPIAGFVCLFLQLTIIGWIPATFWALAALVDYKTDKKIEKAVSLQGFSEKN